MPASETPEIPILKEAKPDTLPYSLKSWQNRIALVMWCNHGIGAVTVMLPSTPPGPMLEHAIRCRAYELYVQRGMAHGHAVDDWLKAEAELVHGHSTSDSTWP
jgi:hypothetical protein